MAQSKKYVENDFLYSGTYSNFDLYGDCAKTDVQWDELIQELCNTFKPGEQSLKISGKTYKVTVDSRINTIREIAAEFKKQTPYNFSYDSSNNLIIDAAKISFHYTDNKTAAYFLGYDENNFANKLPYTLPNKIKITSNAAAASQYIFDGEYNMSINNNKVFDLRAANGTPSNIYFEDKSLTSGLSDRTDKPYINNLRLIQHLNKKKVGYDTNPDNSSDTRNGKCFYAFDYDYNTNKLIVSDLVLYNSVQVTSVSDGMKTITIIVKNTIVNGSNVTETSADYTYEITPPANSTSTVKAESLNDVVEHGGIFRKFDFKMDTEVNTNGTPNDPNDDTTTYKKPKIIAPTVRQKITDGTKITYGGNITGVYTNGVFVCDLYNPDVPNKSNSNLQTFKIAFSSITGGPIVMCSGSKYVNIGADNNYYTLPYTKHLANGTNSSTECDTIKRNKSLCNNHKSAKIIIDKTKTHPGFEQQYLDAKGFSDMSVLNIINLGIGIVAAGVFIAKTYK
jgi:hypothetical protein